MTKNKLPSYSPSRIVNYVRCPYAFYLSLHHKPVISRNTLNLMREGNLFEGYALGFKDNKDEIKLIGRKKPETIDAIKAHAKWVKPVFRAPKHYSYQFIEHYKRSYVIRGEMDFNGFIDVDYLFEITLETEHGIISQLDSGQRYIIDLKYTNDINRVWDFKGSTKEDYIQAAFYPYLWYKKTGKLLDFLYIVVESTFDIPIVRVIHVKIDQNVINWVDDLVEHIDNDIMFKNMASKDACLSGFNQSRCAFMNWCEHGRKIVGGYDSTELSRLFNQIQLPGQKVIDKTL